MQTNPYSLTIPAHDVGIISCDAHASYHQKVTISGFPDGSTITFSGSGEGVPMKHDGRTSYSFGPFNDQITLSILFQFSENGTSFTNGFIRNPPTRIESGAWTIINITSEDATDNDDNDSYLHILFKSS